MLGYEMSMSDSPKSPDETTGAAPGTVASEPYVRKQFSDAQSSPASRRARSRAGSARVSARATWKPGS